MVEALAVPSIPTGPQKAYHSIRAICLGRIFLHCTEMSVISEIFSVLIMVLKTFYATLMEMFHG